MTMSYTVFTFLSIVILIFIFRHIAKCRELKRCKDEMKRLSDDILRLEEKLNPYEDEIKRLLLIIGHNISNHASNAKMMIDLHKAMGDFSGEKVVQIVDKICILLEKIIKICRDETYDKDFNR